MCCFRGRLTLIARAPVSGSFRQITFQAPGTRPRDIRSGFRDFVFPISTRQRAKIMRSAGIRFLMSSCASNTEGLRSSRLRPVGSTTASLTVAISKRPSHRMRGAVENHKIVKLRYLQRLRNRTEGFNRNIGFDAGALAPLFPIGAGTLRDIEVGDFDLPSRGRVLAGKKPRERTLTYTTFLGDQANESRHPYHLHPTNRANTLARQHESTMQGSNNC